MYESLFNLKVSGRFKSVCNIQQVFEVVISARFAGVNLIRAHSSWLEAASIISLSNQLVALLHHQKLGKCLPQLLKSEAPLHKVLGVSMVNTATADD